MQHKFINNGDVHVQCMSDEDWFFILSGARDAWLPPVAKFDVRSCANIFIMCNTI